MTVKTLSPFILGELASVITGDALIGSGMSRNVYAHTSDPGLVIKIEQDAYRFQNIKEWMVWTELQHYWPVAQWLAPCVDISPNGAVLIQRRTTPVGDGMPEKMPSFFTDFKRANFGMFDGRLVCHDYGVSKFLTVGATKRLQLVHWVD